MVSMNVLQVGAPKSLDLGWGKFVWGEEGEQHTSGLYLLISKPSGGFGSHISGFFLQSQRLPFKENCGC